MRKIVIAGGGTGGHISPAISVAESLQRLDSDIMIDFICTPRPVDRRMYAKFGNSVHVLDSPRIDRGGIPAMMALPYRATRTLVISGKLLKKLDPDIVFATGGYSSFFTVITARLMGTIAVLHDSNSIPGKSNRIAARFADRVMLGFSSAKKFFPGKACFTGNPVRSILSRMPGTQARAALELDSEKPVVLFLGGSQGARAINDLALSIHNRGVSVVLQSGERDFERMKKLADGRTGFYLTAFSDDPSPLYSAADLCVARAGAMTVAEICWFRIPTVFVPYPYAADDHQTANAMELADIDASLVLSEEDLDSGRLWSEIDTLLSSGEKLEKIRRNLAGYMPDNPSDTIASMLLDLSSSGRRDGV